MFGVTARSAAACACVILAALLAPSPSTAAPGSIKGKVSLRNGALPEVFFVRVTGLKERKNVTSRAAVRADGTFLLPDLLEGEYRVELLGPEGDVLARTKVRVRDGAETAADLTAGRRLAPAGRKGKVVAGASGGLVLVIAAVEAMKEEACDQDASPSEPGCQR